MEKCFNCQSQRLECKVVDIVTPVGLHKVSDKTISRPVCADCGFFKLSAKEVEGVELRAAVILLSEVKPVTGAILKFARKALDFTQVEPAKRIGTTAESVSRWENDRVPSEPWVALALDGLVREKLHPQPPNVELLKAS